MEWYSLPSLAINQFTFSVFRTHQSATALCKAHAVTCHVLIGCYTGFFTAFHAMLVAVDTDWACKSTT